MRAVICRTSSGSIPFGTWNSQTSPGFSPALAVHEFVGGDKNRDFYRAIFLQKKIGEKNIRRVSSMPCVRSEAEFVKKIKSLNKSESEFFSTKILEEEDNMAKLTLLDNCMSYGADWAIPVEPLGFPGGGMGKDRNFGGGGHDKFNSGNFGGGSSDQSRMRSYYEQMLKSDPTNSLLLRNYGKYLHEVEKDFVKASECYERAILASPEDGEVLSLYGRLIWETQRDEIRAKYYFDQSVKASPDDCMVLGSYAHFMWEADEDGDGDDEEDVVSGAVKTFDG